ncbi:unnamed protein product [Rotaria sordida]|uniref:Uncharacterized protein n=2 Tax=Rotaria sordida TaxID=392033 RepID=A0A820BTC2_9BILA|nr:unnamed protein product [Rotaria sordida]
MVKFIKQSGSNKDIENLGGTTVHQAIDSLQSILKSFKIIKKIFIYKQQHKLIMNIDEKTIKQILLLLKPFKDVIRLIQTGNSPSLHMVLLCFQTLKDVMSSYQSLLDYDKTHGGDESKEDFDETDEDILDELEGITFFWNRIRGVLNEMFALDIRHYAATLLHPKYRSLKACSATERSECYTYVRQQIQLISIEPNGSNEQ